MQGLVLLFTAPIARFDLLALLGPPKLELIQETIHLGHHICHHIHQLMNSEVVPWESNASNAASYAFVSSA
jgi:hypothetical protein